jgi:hypothetical protein
LGKLLPGLQTVWLDEEEPPGSATKELTSEVLCSALIFPCGLRAVQVVVEVEIVGAVVVVTNTVPTVPGLLYSTSPVDVVISPPERTGSPTAMLQLHFAFGNSPHVSDPVTTAAEAAEAVANAAKTAKDTSFICRSYVKRFNFNRRCQGGNLSGSRWSKSMRRSK